jgi:hypothetical protein
MQTVGIVETLTEMFVGSIIRTVKARDEAPGYEEMGVLRKRASKLALEMRSRLKHPATNPEDVEADIRLRVAVVDATHELTGEQFDELLQLIMDESGMTALKNERIKRAARRIG